MIRGKFVLLLIVVSLLLDATVYGRDFSYASCSIGNYIPLVFFENKAGGQRKSLEGYRRRRFSCLRVPLRGGDRGRFGSAGSYSDKRGKFPLSEFEIEILLHIMTECRERYKEEGLDSKVAKEIREKYINARIDLMLNLLSYLEETDAVLVKDIRNLKYLLYKGERIPEILQQYEYLYNSKRATKKIQAEILKALIFTNAKKIEDIIPVIVFLVDKHTKIAQKTITHALKNVIELIENNDDARKEYNDALIKAITKTIRKEDGLGKYIEGSCSVAPKVFIDEGGGNYIAGSKRVLDYISNQLIEMEWRIGDDFKCKLELAFIEACSNAFKHGNKNDLGKPIGIEWKVYKDRLIISVQDKGEGFDINSVPDPLAQENIEKPSGRGIFLMREPTDYMEYNEKRNKVTLTFYNIHLPEGSLLKNLKTNVRWGVKDIKYISKLLREDDMNKRLVAVQLLSMIGIDYREVREMFERIIRDDNEYKEVKEKAGSILRSFQQVIIGQEIEIKIDELTDIKQYAVRYLKEHNIEMAEVFFKSAKGDLENAEFAVYSLKLADYINISEKGRDVEKMWGSVVCLDGDEKDIVLDKHGHIHIVFKNTAGEDLGGHLQNIATKGTLFIRPIYGVHIGRDYDVVTNGRKFDQWKITPIQIPGGIEGKKGAVIRIDDDEDLVDKLKNVARELGIKKGAFRAIGACDKPRSPDRQEQISVRFINERTQKEESRNVYFEYLAEGEVLFDDVKKEYVVNAVVYIAGEDGRIMRGKLIELNNRALGEVILEEEELAVQHSRDLANMI